MNRLTRQQKSSRKPVIVGLIAAKGGVGLTSVALDWARAIGTHDQRCLLLEVAGGDLAWMLDSAPTQFVEDVAFGRANATEAAIEAAPNVDVLVTGSDWAIYGANDPSQTEQLLAKVADGPWPRWLIDFGAINPSIHEAVVNACDSLAVVMTDDLACVSRTYALIRRLTALGHGDKIGLVLNRLTDSAQAKSLTSRFDQITKQFLGRTWPVIGVVPEGAPPIRQKAVDAWSGMTSSAAGATTESNTQIIEPATIADNIENPGVKTYANQL